MALAVRELKGKRRIMEHKGAAEWVEASWTYPISRCLYLWKENEKENEWKDGRYTFCPSTAHFPPEKDIVFPTHHHLLYQY